MHVARYNTNQRKLILDFIEKNTGRHITVDDVLYALKQDGYTVGKATIYRYFDCMVNEGLLRKYSPVDGASSCYEYVGHSDELSGCYHLKCVDCGRLSHLECRFLDEISAHMSEFHNFILNNSKTIFYGTCSECVKKNNGSRQHD